MGDGILAVVAIGINGHLAAVVVAAPDIAFDGTFILVEVAPNQSIIAAVDAVYKELMRQHGLCGFVLGHNHQTCGVLIDTVDEVAEPILDILVGLLEIVGEAV